MAGTGIATVEIGLPIYDDINKQLRYKLYFQSHIRAWYTPVDRLPAFQFYRPIDASNPIDSTNGSAEFVLVNSRTLVESDLLAYFTSAQVVTTYDLSEYYKYNAALVINGLSEGRYYLRIGDGIYTWYSEEFELCDIDGISDVAPSTGDYLLINATEYLLINATDKLYIN